MTTEYINEPRQVISAIDELDIIKFEKLITIYNNQRTMDYTFDSFEEWMKKVLAIDISKLRNKDIDTMINKMTDTRIVEDYSEESID